MLVGAHGPSSKGCTAHAAEYSIHDHFLFGDIRIHVLSIVSASQRRFRLSFYHRPSC